MHHKMVFLSKRFEEYQESLGFLQYEEFHSKKNVFLRCPSRQIFTFWWGNPIEILMANNFIFEMRTTF